MNTDKIVYRMRDHTAATAWLAEQNTRTDAWQAEVEQFLAEQGIGGRTVMATDMGTVVGAPIVDPLPAGWRIHRDGEYMVPDKRTKAGREVAARLKDLTRPDPRSALPGGMPAMSLSVPHILTSGLRELDGTVYVTWSRLPNEADKIDTAVWERAKLSEYYAAREREEAAQERAS